MKLVRITDAGAPIPGPVAELYRISFPLHEQRLAASQKRILTDAEYHFDLIYDEDGFAGIILYWERGDCIYIEHFCILPEKRNRSLGRRTLELMQNKGKTLILEIDPPTDDVSKRRRGFYERCGFAENPYSHVHPPYREGQSGHSLVVMSWPTVLTEGQYADFRCYLEERVMKDVMI